MKTGSSNKNSIAKRKIGYGVSAEVRGACERLTSGKTAWGGDEVAGADFSFITIQNEESASYIVQALHSEAVATKVTRFTLEGSSFDTIKSLGTILETIGSGACPRLVSLNLSNLKILDGQSPHEAFAKLIRSAPLAHLDLSNNRLNLKALGCIAQAMREGPRTLLRLDLNNITSENAPEHKALLSFIDFLLRKNRKGCSVEQPSLTSPPSQIPSSPTSVTDADTIRPSTLCTPNAAQLFGSPPPPFDCAPVGTQSANTKKDERGRQRRRLWLQINANEKSTLTLSSRYVVDESMVPSPASSRQSPPVKRCGDSALVPKQEVSRLPSIC